MKTLKLCLLLSLAMAITAPLGCGSSKTPDDAGSGGAAAGGSNGAAGAKGTGGTPGGTAGTSGGAGGRGGSNGGTAGRADGGTNAGAGGRTDGGTNTGAGGIVLVDASGNTFTCADLMACCNSITLAPGKAACLTEYNMRVGQGNQACGDLLVQLKANSVCN